MKRQLDGDWQRAVRLVADSELRVQNQKLLIKNLKLKGKSATTAEETLAGFERMLLQRRNYLEILQELRRKDPYSD